MTATMNTISSQQLAQWKSQGVEHQLIDIREAYEVETCHISGAHIPMGEIVSRIGEIKRNIPVIIHCKSGRRSEAVATYLERQGFSNVHSLEGGILSWIASIDPSLEAY